MSCIAAITCVDTPVAPIGWPLALRPPERLTGRRPSKRVAPSRTTFQPSPGREAHRLVFDHLGDGEAVVGLDEVEVVDGDARRLDAPRPGAARAFEGGRIAPRQREEVVDVAARAEADGALQAAAVSRRRYRAAAPSETRRAVGAAQRAGDARVLVGDGVAEVEAELLLQVGVGIGMPFAWFLAAIIASSAQRSP